MYYNKKYKLVRTLYQNTCVFLQPFQFACLTHLLQEITLEVDEVVGLDNIRAALAAEHSCKQGLHCWRALPCAHHGISYL